MSDSALLGLFLRDREVFDRYEGMVPEHLLEQSTKTVLVDIRAWYESRQGGSIAGNIDSFWEWMKFVRHPTFTDKKMAGIRAVLRRAGAASTKQTAADLLRSLVLRDWAGRIADKADAFSSGEVSNNFFDDILDDVDSAKQAAGIHDEDSYEVRTPLSELLERIRNPESGLQWRHPHLRDAIGPIRKGDLAAFAAYVDVGKSTFAASETTHIATQLKPGEHVLFFNNEEGGDKVRLRLMRSLLGWTNAQIDTMENRAMSEMRKMLGGVDFDDRIILVDNASITTGLVRAKIRKFNPQFIVFDQLHKIRGIKSVEGNEVESLRRKFEWARGLAKEVAPVFAIHQADSQANGKMFLEMHEMANSKQAIQSEVDYFITMGMDLARQDRRGLYVPKNKSDTPGFEDARKAKVEIFPDFPRARFEK